MSFSSHKTKVLECNFNEALVFVKDFYKKYTEIIMEFFMKIAS